MFTARCQRLITFMQTLRHGVCTFSRFNSVARVWWRQSELASTEILLSGVLLLGLFFCSLGFFFGISCSPVYLWGSFILATFLAGYHSWKRLVTFICWTLGIFCLTAYTFSYTGTDAGAYHVPMQRLLAEGWYPRPKSPRR